MRRPRYPRRDGRQLCSVNPSRSRRKIGPPGGEVKQLVSLGRAQHHSRPGALHRRFPPSRGRGAEPDGPRPGPSLWRGRLASGDHGVSQAAHRNLTVYHSARWRKDRLSKACTAASTGVLVGQPVLWPQPLGGEGDGRGDRPRGRGRGEKGMAFAARSRHGGRQFGISAIPENRVQWLAPRFSESTLDPSHTRSLRNQTISGGPWHDDRRDSRYCLSPI
jgi:hypothetical protein